MSEETEGENRAGASGEVRVRPASNEPSAPQVAHLGLSRQSYLGDGVYVGVDQWSQVWLWTERPENGLNTVALDPSTREMFIRYLEGHNLI